MIAYYIFVFVLGMIFGSFFNVCIYRIPRGESIVKPPSHCMSCNARLKPLDLIPLLSYVFLKARCRYCGTRISVRYPLIELLTATVFVLLFSKYKLTIDFVALTFLIAILIIVFFVDLDHKIIPDGLVITALAGGALATIYNIFYPMAIYGDNNWWNPLLGAVTGSGILFIVAIIGIIIYKSDDAMGGGDIKIFAPIGLFLGWKMSILALVLSVFLAGIISLSLIIFKIKNRRDAIPFGPFIVMGTFITQMWGWDILNWYLVK